MTSADNAVGCVRRRANGRTGRVGRRRVWAAVVGLLVATLVPAVVVVGGGRAYANCSNSTCTPYGQAVTADSPIVWWTLDEAAGTTGVVNYWFGRRELEWYRQSGSAVQWQYRLSVR